MSRLEEIRKKIRKADKDRDGRIERFVLSVARVFERELPRIIKDIDSGDFDTQIGILGTFYDTLKQRGIDDALNLMAEFYRDELQIIQDKFGEIRELPEDQRGNLFGEVDRKILGVAIAGGIDEQDQLIEFRAGKIKEVVLQSIITGDKVDIDQILDNDIPRIAAQMKTELNTTMNAFNRSVTIKKAKDLFGENPKFLYLGPDDGVTRKFCKGLLRGRNPSIYSLKEIQDMNNDQGLPVFQYGGGFNCRHDWRPVSESLEKELKSESGDQV